MAARAEPVGSLGAHPPRASGAARPVRRKGFRRHVAEAVGGLLGLVLVGVAFQLVGDVVDAARFPPPGRMVDVGGYRLHLQCSGASVAGAPTVVLDAGLGAFSVTWRRLAPAIAVRARVCTYDRAGLGWSDPAPTARTSRQIVAELHALLMRAGESPPYVLVGHSFGGHNVRLFAYTYPQLVGGMVLEDVALEDYPALPDVWTRRGRWAGHLVGLTRLTAEYLIQPLVLHVPPEEAPAIRAAFLRTSTATTEYREFAAFEESAAQVREARRSSVFPDVPLISLTRAGIGPTVQRLRAEMAAASPRGRHVIAQTTSHNIHVTEPALVYRSIMDVLAHASVSTTVS